MTPGVSATQAAKQNKALQRYYQWHAKIYDATRWSFLFGRDAIIELAAEAASPQRILEVGCGTGRNLVALAESFPEAQLTGLDVSPAMLAQAKHKLSTFGGRVHLACEPYPLNQVAAGTYDLILFSYALSMFNPGWETAIRAAKTDLAEDGVIAAVDFHHSKCSGFRRWMGMNHVRMEAHLLPVLESEYQKVSCNVFPVYAGLWKYFLFTGKRA
jgi:S-adenosylmethionine-diacylgycerolhomoserine-N-methlytransferase